MNVGLFFWCTKIREQEIISESIDASEFPIQHTGLSFKPGFGKVFYARSISNWTLRQTDIWAVVALEGASLGAPPASLPIPFYSASLSSFKNIVS